MHNRLNPIQWVGGAAGGHLRLLDQTKLPTEVTHLDCRTVEEVWGAIKRLSVRGAPAIGIAAAYGCVVAVGGSGDEAACADRLAAAADHLATSRPTAVNLFWALERMRRVRPCLPERLLSEARAIHAEDAAMCRRIGEHGLGLLEELEARGAPQGGSERAMTLLTHCNAGALATGGIGTATAPMYLARERGRPLKVYADETRPLLQGARLTALELASAGIDVTLLCDNMAATVLRSARVTAVIVGADRIAANGDAANKIGTYPLAIVAAHHRVPFLVAAPSSTFDLSIPDGSHIPIEERDSAEITRPLGRLAAPTELPSFRAFNPAFDVTPAGLIHAIVTERGVVRPVDVANVRRVLGG